MRRFLPEDLPHMLSVVLPPMVAMASAAVVVWLSVGGTLEDIGTFRLSAIAVLDGRSPYGVNPALPFVYPPGGVLIILLAAIGPDLQAATVVWSGVSIAALARTAWILTRQAWPNLDTRRLRNRALWLFSIACLLEPTLLTLSSGQVGLLVLWLTLEGLGGQPLHPQRGWMVGAAAAVKLTPSLVVVALAVAGRWRTVMWAVVGFAGTTIVAGFISPPALHDYFETWRLAYEFNARPLSPSLSLVGVATQTDAPGWIGWSVSALVLIVGVATAGCHWHRGDQLAGVATVLVTTLLISPVSWGHTWVAVYPALVLLLREITARQVSSLVLLSTAVTGLLLRVDVVGGYRISTPPPGETLPLLLLLRSDWLVIWGVAFLCWIAVPLLSGRPVRLLGPRFGGEGTH